MEDLPRTTRIGGSQFIGTVIVYICEGIQQFEDGTSEKVITCGSDGLWQPLSLPKCQCKLQLINSSISFSKFI